LRGAQHRFGGLVVERANPIEPWSRRVNDGPGAYANHTPVAVEVANDGSIEQPLGILRERVYDRVVQANGSGFLRPEGVLQHETSVVREAVIVERSTEKTVFAKQRLDSLAVVAADPPVSLDVTEGGQHVVQRQSET